MSLPNWVKVERRQAFSAAGNAAKSANGFARGADADTLRRRALDDARGTVLRQGTTYRAHGAIPWQICRSRAGRTDQLDVVVDGKLWRTAGPRMVATLFLRAGKK